MKKNDLIYVGDIYQCIIRIQKSMLKISKEDFEDNYDKQDAAIKNLMIVGEATSKISMEFRDQHKEVPWREMKSMRNILIHSYQDSDLNIIWSVVQNQLPALRIQLEKLLNDNPA